MSDGLEEAVAGVAPGSSSGGSEIVREKIIYPAAPPGLYRAMCVSSEEKDFKGYQSDEMEKKYSLRFELRLNVLTGQMAEYKGTDDKPHKFSLWGKPLTRNFADGRKNGKPSNCYKLFKELYGIPPPTSKRDEIRTFGNINKVVEIISFDHKLFEGAEVIIKVGQKTLDDGRVVNTCEYEGFSCDDEMKLRNYNQLPPQVKEKFPFPGAQTAMKPSQPAASATASSSSATAPSSAPSAMSNPADASAPDADIAAEAPHIFGEKAPSNEPDPMADERARQAEVAKNLPI